MKLFQKTIFNGFFFALYHILMMKLFGVSDFIQQDSNELFFYLLTFLFLFVFNSGVGFGLSQLLNDFIALSISKIATYFISILLCVYIILTFFILQDYLLVIGYAMFISSLLPALLVIWGIYIEYLNNQVRLTIEFLSEQIGEENVEKEIFTLRNKNDMILFSSSIDDIILFEANDNYVNIYYLDEEKNVHKQMERLSLKKVESLLENYDKLFHRIHKSYLLNPDYLLEINGRSQAYKLKIRHINKLIPVSRMFNIDDLKQIQFG